MAVEDRAVNVDRKPLGLGDLDCGHGFFEAALHAYRLVMMVPEAVEMNREEKIRRWFEYMQLLLEQQRVGAQRDEFFSCYDAFDDLADFLVDERFAARNGDHRRTALVDCIETLLHRQSLV